MTKIDAELKEAILKDKSSMKTKQLQEKYGLSRSSIQRIKLPDLESRIKEFQPSKPQDESKAVEFVETLMKETPPPQQLNTPQREDTIQRNADTFPSHYPFIQDKNAFVLSLSTKSAPELHDLLTTMENTRSLNNLSAQMKQVFLISARATETLGTRIRLKTQGLTDALLQQQQELDYIFKELALTYQDKFKSTTRPEIKLLSMFGMTLLSVDAQNRIKEAMKKPEEKYADL
jgi:hypothetical protein